MLKRNEVSLVARLFIKTSHNHIEFGAQLGIFEKRKSDSDDAYAIRTENPKLDAYRHLKVSGFLSPEMVQEDETIYFQGFQVRAASNGLNLDSIIALGSTAKSLDTKLKKAEEEQGSCYSLSDLMLRVFDCLKVDEIWFETKSELEDKPRHTVYLAEDLDDLFSFANSLAFKQMGWAKQAS
tara:strand:- start:16191 stop:16733 length:543 start_codon:yes stop_codon:yes gene_type:complete